MQYRFFFGFFLLSCICARIDNNRREYWWRELRKMVCMCVCSAFFFFMIAQLCKLFLKSNQRISNKKLKRLKSNTYLFVFFFVGFLFLLCENRQQPTWILGRKSCERWCTCVCAPHFFLFLFAQLCDLYDIRWSTQNKTIIASYQKTQFCFFVCVDFLDVRE